MATDYDPLAPRARLVHRLAETEGFALTGIAPARPSEHEAWVRQWISAGRHGEMEYLARRLDVRLDPTRLLPGAQAVIVVADFYEKTGRAAEGDAGQAAERPSGRVEAAGDSARSAEPGFSAPRGRIARYALGDDYHKVMKKRLHRLADGLHEHHPDEEFKCTVDTAPILEREQAERAGLGWCGKHTLLIHPRLGSWMLLGTIVTTLRLQTTAEAGYPGPTLPPTDHCGSCTRCIDACPTGCIADPRETGHRSIDASRCISYLTLEHRGPIDPGLHEPMGDWLAGCDICQQVCPYNQRPDASDPPTMPAMTTSSGSLPAEAAAPHPRYAPRDRLAEGLELLEVLGWTGEDRQAAFQGSALKRIKLDMLKRNALIAAGNVLMRHDDAGLRERIEHLAVDGAEAELVRLTARQVLERLADRSEPREPRTH